MKFSKNGGKLPSGKGFGLAGMRERVLAANGSFELEQSRHGGLQLKIELPLSNDQQDDYLGLTSLSRGNGVKPGEM